ncbi:hypothetical protein Gorai_007440 [Gossypium raimondii]|uniref:Uncharacterized protein n=1 Tax=Gossypium raimondii TaxID=29730 RepID=A0A7J8Q8M7_GOSRA|nr:hypothetical protein [Gossypium raimondii]
MRRRSVVVYSCCSHGPSGDYHFYVEPWPSYMGLSEELEDIRPLLDQHLKTEFEWMLYIDTDVISCILLEMWDNRQMWVAKVSLHEEHIEAWDRRAILTRSQTIFRSGHGDVGAEPHVGADADVRIATNENTDTDVYAVINENIDARYLSDTTEKDDYAADPEETTVQWVVLDTYLGDDDDDEKPTGPHLRIHSC